jgi:isopentenyldiphosphate isomerase
MQIPLVDEQDEIIGSKEHVELDYAKDTFRTASLWITSSNGDILLARRRINKKVDPGKWAEAVGGTVEGDDSYENTIIREAEEELGLKDIEISLGPKQFIDSSAKYFVQWYIVTVDYPIDQFVIQEEEVEQIAWISKAQLRQELISNPSKYIPAMQDIVTLFGVG